MHLVSVQALAAKFEQHCGAYFKFIETAAAQGSLRSEDGSIAKAFYPNFCLISETPTHIVFELLGATEHRPESVRTVLRSMPSLGAVMGKLPAPATVNLAKFGERNTGGHLAHLALMSDRSRDIFDTRYQSFSDLHQSFLLFRGANTDSGFHPLGFDDSLLDVALIDVMLMADYQGQVRARYFQAALIVNSATSSSEMSRQLHSRFPIGQSTELLAPVLDTNRSLLVTAANLAALASMSSVGETTISRFLEENASVLALALGGERIIPQPKLEWVVGNSDPEEKWIQPDFLLVSSDGSAHICELKLPLLSRSSITAGGHRRRRFVADVADGIAQLANYRDYFSYSAHRDIVQERFGVAVGQARSILVVGSAENVDAIEVREAQRMLAPVEIVDYDTLRTLYLLGGGYVPTRARASRPRPPARS